ncbi:hypothetical protein PV327_001162 [Microctonus hyperodae]|uniref:Secreted protein n=1 Tax=Microctonus hyperodae TaxID=165561 RepID=A0AA39G7N0_MICHY|nr:hypothetical protein PV327_001162 [Microctonus hyperodae]
MRLFNIAVMILLLFSVMTAVCCGHHSEVTAAKRSENCNGNSRGAGYKRGRGNGRKQRPDDGSNTGGTADDAAVDAETTN